MDNRGIKGWRKLWKMRQEADDEEDENNTFTPDALVQSLNGIEETEKW